MCRLYVNGLWVRRDEKLVYWNCKNAKMFTRQIRLIIFWFKFLTDKSIEQIACDFSTLSTCFIMFKIVLLFRHDFSVRCYMYFSSLRVRSERYVSIFEISVGLKLSLQIKSMSCNVTFVLKTLEFRERHLIKEDLAI
ncbi:hypothetical protein V8G54_008777 [Vigna mungo]|uniref:Uncharacterized protein n=1 Tax=Vigna mungo TaxID=3915 RepID=A0AAQ3P4K7_VIGMU